MWEVITRFDNVENEDIAVERFVGWLIRCKDCKWYKTNYSWNGKEHQVCVIEPYEPVRKADDFCSRAERKEE